MQLLRNSRRCSEFSSQKRAIFGIAIVGAVLSVPHVLIAQHIKLTEQKEQSGFGIELEVAPIQRPVTLPRVALDALSKDEGIASCLENEALSAEELPANWFVASQIHLDGPNEADLIVLPGERIPDTPAGEISPNACLLGANTAQMWVLRGTQNGFKLVLSQIGLGMDVLSRRTNGLRDIEISAVVGGYSDSISYKFDGESYKIAARKSELIGAELPRMLSVFKIRRRFIQSPDQTSEVVRVQARAWLWRQWKKQRTSYLKLRTYDEKTDETCSYFIAPDEDGKWQVTIHVRRIVHDDDATASQHRIIEKELLVATQVQLVEPATDDTHLPKVISKGEIRAGSTYRLQFVDYGDRTVATL